MELTRTSSRDQVTVTLIPMAVNKNRFHSFARACSSHSNRAHLSSTKPLLPLVTAVPLFRTHAETGPP